MAEPGSPRALSWRRCSRLSWFGWSFDKALFSLPTAPHLHSYARRATPMVYNGGALDGWLDCWFWMDEVLFGGWKQSVYCLALFALLVGGASERELTSSEAT